MKKAYCTKCNFKTSKPRWREINGSISSQCGRMAIYMMK